jgi:hypothetical protein
VAVTGKNRIMIYGLRAAVRPETTNGHEDVEGQLSPSGWPPGCCHVRVVGVVSASDTTRAEM